jgi:hypothetical protein
MTTKLYRVEFTCSFYVAAEEEHKTRIESDSSFHTYCLENEINFPDMVSVEEVETLDQIPTVWRDASPYAYPSLNHFLAKDLKLCRMYVENSSLDCSGSAPSP